MSGTLAANRGPAISPNTCRGPSGSGRCPGGRGEERTIAPRLREWDDDEEPAPPGTATPLDPEGVLGTIGQSRPEKSGCAIEFLRGCK